MLVLVVVAVFLAKAAHYFLSSAGFDERSSIMLRVE
jgi:hypothetical protein